MSVRFDVPGEDLPAAAWAGALVVGLACASGALACASDGVLSTPAVAQPASEVVPTPSTSSEPPEAAIVAEERPLAPTPRQRRDCDPIAILFPSDSARPEPAEGPRISAIASFLAEHTEASVVLHGHADSRGSEIENLRLSRRRALAVASMLERAGVARRRLTSQGFGAYQPTPGAATTAGANRRVVVWIDAAECDSLDIAGDVPRGRTAPATGTTAATGVSITGMRETER